MSHAQTVEAIILRVYDVGEADRFCILFTRELGRVAARASAVRKPKSRMGGTLLPLKHVSVQLKQSSAGFIIAGAMLKEEIDCSEIAVFAHAGEGVELLLALLQDQEPLPGIFGATIGFFKACGNGPQIVLGYKLYLLHVLGFLPGPAEMVFFADLTAEEHHFVDTAARGDFHNLPPLRSYSTLRGIAGRIFAEQAPGLLKAPGVVAALG